MGAVPVGTLGGKITIIHRRKSKVASRIVNSHCAIPRRLTSSINWNENSVANGLIFVAVSRRNRGWDKPMEKTTSLEGNSLFMNSETPEIRKVQVKLRGTTCCLQGRSTRATWVSCPRFVKNCPGPSFQASNTCMLKITWQISQPSTRTEYFVPLWSVLLENFCAEIIDNVWHW